MAETPRSTILTRQARQKFTDSQKMESAPVKFKKLILPHGSDREMSSLDKEEYIATPVPCKLSPRGTVQQSTCASKTTVCSKKSNASSIARRKQLELQAAEAKAKIQMELIDKKLEADLAKVSADENNYANPDAAPDEDHSTRRSRSVLNEQTYNNVENWLDRNCAPVQPRDDEIQQLAHTLKDMMKQTASQHEDRLLSRLATPRELPLFSGDCVEWLHFKSAYDDSTLVCKFSDSENLWRLRRALRGEAKEAVTDLLIGNTPPSAVIEALELRFGRADIIIQNIAMQLKKLPSLPNFYQSELSYFAVKVNNCVATMRALNQDDYLRSPELAAAIVSKLPSTLMSKWTDYAYNRLHDGRSKLELLATFLKREAEMLSTVGCTQPREYKNLVDKGYKQTDHKLRHRSVYTTVITENKKCLYCEKGDHMLSDCRIFKRAMRKDKWNFVKKQRLCYCCLSTKQHNSKLCPSPVCDVDNCGMAHHRLLHWTKPAVTSQSADAPLLISQDGSERDSTAPDASITHIARDDVTDQFTSSTTTEEFALLKVLPVKLRGPKGIISTYALLDDGAAVSIVDSKLSENLGLLCENSSAIKFTDAFGLTVYQTEVPKVKVQISGQDNAFHDIYLRKCDKLKLSAQNMSVVNKIDSSYLAHVKPFICTHNVVPRVLLGQDNYFLIAPLEIVQGDKNSLYASRCKLGWTIHGYHKGRTHSSVSELNVFHLARSPDIDECMHEISELNDLIKNSFSLDSVGISTLCRENKDHFRAIDILDKTSRQIGTQWEVGLPFRKDDFNMPDSYFNAYSRHQLLLRKFQKDNNYACRYKLEMTKLFDSGYARELRNDELLANHIWYLPHFSVQNPNKPEKLRLVYDAASKVCGVSLNDYLLTGPDLYNSLFGIMLRFRANPIAIIADIRDMFLRIRIRSEDQHVLRFLWQESTDSQVKVCVMQSLIFGSNASPFIAQYIKNKNALKYADINSEAVDVIINDHYMDNCLHSTCDENKAIQLVHDITSIHKKGGFEIRGWSSNSKQVLDSIPTDALARTAIEFKDGGNKTAERTLGLIWHHADDSFGFKINLSRIPSDILNGTVPPTKAKMLSIIMSVYDIHGFLSPFLIKSKIILQDVHRSGVDWKCQILPAEHTKWIKWIDELKQLESLRIPRWYLNAGAWTQCYSNTTVGNNDADIIDRQMHIFCDSSLKSVSSVIFWRWTRRDGRVLVSFAAAKSRVTPLRPMSVPRLELQGALIAARLADTLQRQHKDMKPNKRYFWTDSHTVLQWIRSDPRNYKAFVAYRLGEIDELTVTSEWRYVPSKLNVADIATKEESPPLVYQSVWFQGPNFLRQPEDSWPKDLSSTKKSQGTECELRNINFMTSHVIERSLPNENDFSSWLRLVRVTARVLLFLKRCRRMEVQLDVKLLNEAEKLLLKKCQQDSFAEDIERLKQNKPLLSTSRLLTLTPYIDTEGMLRVHGRVDKVQCVEQSVKRPAILDGHHRITRLLVEHYHRNAMHGAHELVVNELRQRYWIIKLRPTVRAVASRCLFCLHRRAVPHPQRMGNLPAARLQHNRQCFSFVGIDFFGPMEVTVGRKRQKRYGVIFTCLTMRAIHLELTESLTTDSAIMALRRMIARRGTPTVIYSDNGPNLRGMDNELKRSVLELNKSKLCQDGSIKGIEWRFLPPGAPEMAGAWERLIGTVKRSLKVILKERAPHPETLSTLMVEVEALVNSRPITYVSCDPNYPEALTPNHFLIGTSSNGPIFGRYDDKDLCLRKQWRIAQRLTDMFWVRWIKEYLPTLLPRYKWNKEQRALRVGDFVLLIEPNLDRGSWRHGVVSETHSGDDGRIRVVDVRTRTGIVRRPVTRVALLSPAELRRRVVLGEATSLNESASVVLHVTNITVLTAKAIHAAGYRLHKVEHLSIIDAPKLAHVAVDDLTKMPNLKSFFITQAPLLHRIAPLPALPELRTFMITTSGLLEVPNLSHVHDSKKGNMSYLQAIDLEGNHIKRIPVHALRVRADQVSLSYNLIEEVPAFAFKNAQISKLSFRGNTKLKRLDDNAFSGNLLLRQLDLSNTAITSLPIKGLEKLETLRIEKTPSLKYIPSIYEFQHLEKAYLTHHFHCCAFAFPERHNPARHKLYETQLAMMKQRCLSNQKQRKRRSLEPIREIGEGWENKRTSRSPNEDLSTATTSEEYDSRFYVDEYFSDSGSFEDEDQGEFHEAINDTLGGSPISTDCGNFTISRRIINCTPLPDALNPCEDVMGWSWLRASVWIVISAAIIGNVAVLLVLLMNHTELTVPRFLMCHLAFSDLCTGLYLFMIAVVDLRSFGEFFNYAYDWQYGVGCKIAGFLSVFSGQLSVFTLTIVTLERWFAITYAIYLERRISLPVAAKIMMSGWLFSILMAGLPLLGVSDYSSTSICLPVESKDVGDAVYQGSLFMTNAVAWVTIVVCYVQIYRSLGGGESYGGRGAAAAAERKIANKMALLIGTDLLCWAPVAFFGVTALAGVPLVDVSHGKVLLVFFYPLNACANPFLYAILTKQYRRDLLTLVARSGKCNWLIEKHKLANPPPTGHTNPSAPVNMPLVDYKRSQSQVSKEYSDGATI